jgi:hypothetical protein
MEEDDAAGAGSSGSFNKMSANDGNGRYGVENGAHNRNHDGYRNGGSNHFGSTEGGEMNGDGQFGSSFHNTPDAYKNSGYFDGYYGNLDSWNDGSVAKANGDSDAGGTIASDSGWDHHRTYVALAALRTAHSPRSDSGRSQGSSRSRSSWCSAGHHLRPTHGLLHHVESATSEKQVCFLCLMCSVSLMYSVRCHGALGYVVALESWWLWLI